MRGVADRDLHGQTAQKHRNPSANAGDLLAMSTGTFVSDKTRTILGTAWRPWADMGRRVLFVQMTSALGGRAITPNPVRPPADRRPEIPDEAGVRSRWDVRAERVERLSPAGSRRPLAAGRIARRRSVANLSIGATAAANEVAVPARCASRRWSANDFGAETLADEAAAAQWRIEPGHQPSAGTGCRGGGAHGRPARPRTSGPCRRPPQYPRGSARRLTRSPVATVVVGAGVEPPQPASAPTEHRGGDGDNAGTHAPTLTCGRGQRQLSSSP